MGNTKGFYAVMSMKNTPVPKDSSYWEDRKDIIYHLNRYSRQVEWLAKDLGAKIIYGDDYINANVVWRESGEPANQIEKLIDGGVISTTEFHGRVHGKFKLCDETMSSIDTELRNSYRKYRLLKNCLKENSEEPIASIIALGNEVGDKANEFFDKYSEYLALDDIKRWYSDCIVFNDLGTTIKNSLEKAKRKPLKDNFRVQDNSLRFHEPMRGNIVDTISVLDAVYEVVMREESDGDVRHYRATITEVMEMYSVLVMILEDPVICIKSEEEVTVGTLVKVREIRKNLSLFQRLYRKVLG